MPKTDKRPFRPDLRGKLVEVASSGGTISYLELGVGRAMVGRYLFRIAAEEAHAGRPPLTAVVVRKGAGRPGEGFKEAMIEARYTDSADPRSDDEIWLAAIRDVHEYWRPKLTESGKPPVSGQSAS